MSRFVKFVSAVALVASLAPFAAQARSSDFNTTMQAGQNGASISSNSVGG